MYFRLQSLYNAGQIDDVGLTTAVNKRWIKEDEKQQIISSKQDTTNTEQ